MNTTVVSEAQLLSLTERISAKLLSEHPVSSESISGEEIKSFFPHGQLNSFLLFQIYQVWDQRVQQLKHPYFDFSSEDVQEVLESLKNRLAHHISVDAESFTSLVDRSVANTLGFIIAPKNGFKQFFYPQGQDLAIDQLEQYSHFFSDWDFVVNSILKYCQKHEKNSISWEDFSNKMERVLDIYEQKKGQSILEYRKKLYHSLTGEDLEAFLSDIERQRKEEAEAQRAREEEERRQQEMEAARKRAEEEQKRLEAERLAREEEERLRKEAEANKKTIFDDLGGSGETLDLDDDFEEPVTEQVEAALEKAVEDVSAPLEEVTSEVEEVVEKTVEEVKEEVAQTDEDEEFLEMAASLEPVKESEPEAEEPKTTLDRLSNGASTFLDRFQAKKEEAEEVVEETTEKVREKTEEAVEKIQEEVEEVIEKVEDPAPAATPVFENRNSETPEEEESSSILDKIQEKSQTVADKFAEQTRARKLHESINGNQKIKLDEIPIHKQYQYVQKVFGGNNVRFRIIVDRINDARDANEVEDILNKFVLSIDDLDREDPVVQEFVQMLRNRF